MANVMRVASVDDEPVHLMFELSYANYLVLERALLQSMPLEWQRRFVACLEEFEVAVSDVERAETFCVRAKRWSGQFMSDPVPHYNRGRTTVALREYEV